MTLQHGTEREEQGAGRHEVRDSITTQSENYSWNLWQLEYRVTPWSEASWVCAWHTLSLLAGGWNGRPSSSQRSKEA